MCTAASTCCTAYLRAATVRSALTARSRAACRGRAAADATLVSRPPRARACPCRRSPRAACVPTIQRAAGALALITVDSPRSRDIREEGSTPAAYTGTGSQRTPGTDCSQVRRDRGADPRASRAHTPRWQPRASARAHAGNRATRRARRRSHARARVPPRAVRAPSGPDLHGPSRPARTCMADVSDPRARVLARTATRDRAMDSRAPTNNRAAPPPARRAHGAWRAGPARQGHTAARTWRRAARHRSPQETLAPAKRHPRVIAATSGVTCARSLQRPCSNNSRRSARAHRPASVLVCLPRTRQPTRPPRAHHAGPHAPDLTPTSLHAFHAHVFREYKLQYTHRLL